MRVFKRVNTAGQTLSKLGHSHFPFCLAPNRFPDIGSVGQIEKKKAKKKVTRGLGIAGPRNPGRC